MPNLLTTNWCVLTGAAAAGKSVVLENLATLGYLTVRESARYYLQCQLALGIPIAAHTRDQLQFQRNLLRHMTEIEDNLDPGALTFLDRALGDGVGFFLAAGFDLTEALSLCGKHRYRRVFLLERVPDVLLSDDPLRFRTKEENAALEQYLERGYSLLGYKITRIPFGPVVDRVALILKDLRGEELAATE
jgi:predicted ATPase